MAQLPPEIEAFATYLANLTDEKDRNRALRKSKLIAAQKVPEEALQKEPLIRTLEDYLAADIKVPPVLVHPYMCVRGGINVTVGRAGKGKTVMNLNRMLRWSAGVPMLPGWTDADGNDLMAPEKPLRILVVENEGAAGMFHRQIGLMLHATDYLSDDERALAKKNFWVWKEGGYSNLKMDDEAKLNELRAEIERWEPDLVFIEPFRSLWNGEENSATDMTTVVDALANIAADFDCGVWIAHHEKKGGSGEDDKMSAARGSTVLEGIVTVMENFESIKGGDQREITYSKSRYHKPPNPVRLEWDHESWWYKWVPTSDLEEAILDALRTNEDEPMNVRMLCEELDEKDHALRKVLKKLEADGRVKTMASVSDQRGSTGKRYRLPTSDTNDGGGLGL